LENEIAIGENLAKCLQTGPFRLAARVFEVVGGSEVNIDFVSSQTELPICLDTYKAKFIPEVRGKPYFSARDVSSWLGCSESWAHKILNTYSKPNAEIGRGDKKVVISSAICTFSFKGADYPKEVRDARNIDPNRHYYVTLKEIEQEYAYILPYIINQYAAAESMFSKEVLGKWDGLLAKWGSKFFVPQVQMVPAGIEAEEPMGVLTIEISPQDAGKVTRERGLQKGVWRLKAIPYDGYEFAKWGLIGCEDMPEVELIVNTNRKAIAYFKPKLRAVPREPAEDNLKKYEGSIKKINLPASGRRDEKLETMIDKKDFPIVFTEIYDSLEPSEATEPADIGLFIKKCEDALEKLKELEKSGDERDRKKAELADEALKRREGLEAHIRAIYPSIVRERHLKRGLGVYLKDFLGKDGKVTSGLDDDLKGADIKIVSGGSNYCIRAFVNTPFGVKKMERKRGKLVGISSRLRELKERISKERSDELEKEFEGLKEEIIPGYHIFLPKHVKNMTVKRQRKGATKSGELKKCTCGKYIQVGEECYSRRYLDRGAHREEFYCLGCGERFAKYIGKREIELYADEDMEEVKITLEKLKSWKTGTPLEVVHVEF
jgi:hypothetical protein